ncbi:MAG: EAL domain-containing protein [Kibdelosporangium sp.]
MPQREPTSPLPDDSRADDRDLIRERRRLARKWACAITATAYVSLSRDELEDELHDLLDRLYAALRSEPSGSEAVAHVTERLSAMNSSDPGTLRSTVDVLGRSLLSQSELRDVEQLAEKVIMLIGALAADYAEAIRVTTFAQQEEIKQAMLTAVRDAKWNLAFSEAKFDEVATCSASGIVLTELDGTFVRTNDSFGEILGYRPGDLAGRSLFDIVHPAEADYLRQSCENLLNGSYERVRQSQRLIRSDGDAARVSLTATLLRDGDEKPGAFVVVVEDGTELRLLQNELSRQALHDMLTGLPNRQFFSTHLEGVLRRADPAYGVSLYHLDLDGFSLITGGLGRNTGDLLLMAVAERLKAVMSAEQAMVARFDGDEFAILVENRPETPDPVRTVMMINAELSEPVYIEGHGVAATAAIGVVHRPSRDMDPADLLRASDMTLRRAKGNGRRQWELFHPDQHRRDRETLGLAAEMPGAWESGELVVNYRPIVRLQDKQAAGTEALLHWDHPRLGVVGGERCLELAEETGLILALGPWLLRTACEQLRWERDLPIGVNLTAHQSSDADLVGEVLRALRDTGLPPERLSLGMPVQALLAANGEAMENLKLLAENGVGAVAVDFGAMSGDLVCVEEVRLRAVRVARWLVEREPVPGSPVTHALLDMSSLVHLSGAQVMVDGVRTEEQADWWRAAGADMAQGEFFS